MTPVRQDAGTRTDPRTSAPRKLGAGAATTKSKSADRRGSRALKAAASRKQTESRAGARSQVAQVRLQADEMAALHEVMHQLRLPSTSEALREGIRLLIRDASELAAAEEIRHFYGASQAPLPDGVTPATEEDLAATDAAQW